MCQFMYTHQQYMYKLKKNILVKMKMASDLRFVIESALSKMSFTPVGNKNDAQIFLL